MKYDIDMNRVEVLLALILLGQMGKASKKKKITALSVAGFTNVEIANILEMYASDVATTLHSDK